jgi:hypothetical protein
MAAQKPPAFVRFLGNHPLGHIRSGDVCRNPDPKHLDGTVGFVVIDEAEFRRFTFMTFDATHLSLKPEPEKAPPAKVKKNAADAADRRDDPAAEG